MQKPSQLIRFFIITLPFQLLSLTLHAQNKNDLIKIFSGFKGGPGDSSQLSVTNKLAEKYLYNNSDSAMYYGRVALQFSKKHQVQTEKAKAFNNISKIHYIKGSYFESLSYADSALTESSAIGFKAGTALAINTRGLIYLSQDRVLEAIGEFKKALFFNTQLKDSSRIAANYFNIGLAYDQSGQYKNAFPYLKKALDVAKRCKDGHLSLMSLNRIAETNFHSGNYDQALSYFQSALGFTGYQDNWEKGFAYAGLAQTLYAMKRYDRALDFANKGFEQTMQLKAKWDIERASNILSKTYAALGDFQQAYHYQTISRAYGDSLRDEKKEKEITYLHLKEKRAENLILTRENEHSRHVIENNRIIILLILLFSIVLIISMLLLKRSVKHKNALNRELRISNDEILQQKQEIDTQREALLSVNKTKDRVLSVIGHDLRSPFASITQALEIIREGDLDEQEQAFVLENFQQQISLVSQLINNLLAWANSQQSGATTQPDKVNLAEITAGIVSLYQPSFQQKKQQVHHEQQAPVFISADKNHVKIILQNIISNAIKFTPEKGTISLFYSYENGQAAVHIKDSGQGMSQDKLTNLFKSSGKAISENGTNNEPGTGLGLLFIRQFIEDNNGQIKVTSEKDKGSEFVIYFKSWQ